MILNIIQPKVDPHLRSNENGFRPGRSTAAHILALRKLLERATLVFINFKKTFSFDSMHRGKMLKILRVYGVSEKLASAIGLLYPGTKAKVLLPDRETEFFEIPAGVLQGDTLALYIFTIMIIYAMRQAIGNDALELGFKLDRRRRRRHNPNVITDLDFADDIALVIDELEQAQDFLHSVQENAAKIGLHLNSDKTEFMSFNQVQDSVLKTVNNENIKKVDNFKYLEAWIGDTANYVKIRKALARKSCNKLNKIWKSSPMQIVLKIRTFLTVVESVLLYGSERWTLTKSLEESIDGTYTRLLRTFLKVSWPDHLINSEFYGNLPKVTEKIREKRLKLPGHYVTHSKEVASNLVLWKPSNRKPNRGRKRKTYLDKLMNNTNTERADELQSLIMDGDLWRCFIIVAVAGVGARPT